MRVLFINTVCGNGSTGHIVMDLVNALNLNGDEGYVAYGFYSTDYAKSYRFSTKREYVRHARYWSHILGLHGRGSHISTFKLLKWIDSVQPDIIHFHNLHGSYVNVRMLVNYINKHNIPVVWTLHDCWCMTGHCAHFFHYPCDGWKTGCHHCKHNGDYKEVSITHNDHCAYEFKKKLFTSIKNMTIVPVSYWLESLIKQSFLREKKIKTIHNGIDLDVFSPNTACQSESIKVIREQISGKFVAIGVATSWNEAKGLKDYYKLSQMLQEDERIIMVGLSKDIIGILPPKIIGVERTESQQELSALYCMSDVVLSMSYGESLGTTPLEGMACGTPAIVYDNTGHPEEIVEGQTGYVVPTGNVDAVFESIKKVKSNSKAFYEKACIDRTKQCFQKSVYLQEYLDLYKSILSYE